MKIHLMSMKIRTVITSSPSSVSTSTNHENSTSSLSAEHASPTRSVDSANSYVDEASDSESIASFAMSEDYHYSSSDMSGLSDVSTYKFSDDSTDSEDYFHDENKEKDAEFINDIQEVALEHNFRHIATKDLLRVLRKHTSTLFPKDPRTLFGTPTKTHTLKIEGGEYYHFVINFALIKLINDLKLNKVIYTNNINLQINIDGAPLHNSTVKGIWLIQCSVSGSKYSYLIGLFYGQGKPRNIEEFLRSFVDEMKDLIENGFRYLDEVFEVTFHTLICDVPAKSMLLNIKGHTGYNSCTSCHIVGQRIDNVTCFPPEGPVTLRTDHQFSELAYLHSYQKGTTIINEIPNLGMVSNVPRDYMHLICLGVTRKLLFLWKYGPIENRLTTNSILLISDRLETAFKHMPTDFARRPRSLKYIKLWKATEFRQFLIYTGPIVLQNIVRDDIYVNFLHLHVAMRILTNKEKIRLPENKRLAETLLNRFITGFIEIYGPKYVSHNIHNLVHVVMDVDKFGILDNFSAFKFESFIFFF